MANLTYDANGNLVSDWADTYGWDAQNRLVSINASTAHGIYFAYDSVGRRSAQYQAASNIYSTYLYDGQNKIQEGGTTTVNYLTGGLDENFVRSQGGSNNDYLRDALGSTIGLLDSNAGWVQGYTYESFGETTPVLAHGAPNDVMYTGREGIGPFLTYNRGRYYDSLLKRFISEDPIGWASGQANNYAYVSGNPVSYTDPTGKYGLPGAAYGAVSGGVGGYVTGGWPGAGLGTLIGAGIGLVTPEGLPATVVGNMVASLLGQVAGNARSGKPLGNLNYCAAAGAGVGAGAGNLLAGTAVGSGFWPIITPVIGSDLETTSVIYPATGVLTATGEGLGDAVGENTAGKP